MEFGVTLIVLILGATYIRKLEKRIEVQDSKIFTMEQLLEMNLIKDEKEKSKTTKKAVKGKA
jgi:hypothetical protein